MKKTIFKITAFVLASGILFFYGCQKNLTNDNPLTEKNVQLVQESVAVSIAEHFKPSDFFNESNPTNNSNTRSTLTGQNKIKAKYLYNDSYGNPAIYIFNFENNAGFIFVSADYQMQPILAFVEHGAFKKDTVPAGLLAWVDKTMENIEIVRQGLYDNSKVAAVAWRNYYKQNGNGGIKALKEPPVDNNNCSEDKWTATSVGPLLSVTWGQGCSYNDLCPELSCDLGCGNGRALTGCVATSTSQVIKYWHPTNSYNYNYASMTATSGNGEVQRLMSDVGRAINMSYGCTASSANSSNIIDVLKGNFGFTSANNGKYTWQGVQGNLNNHWPVVLNACRTKKGNWFIDRWNKYSDCHSWVCDGYNQFNFTFCENGQYTGSSSYLYFHMNWGWHEWYTNISLDYPDYNGWFAFDNWDIAGINRNYQYAQEMVGDIHP
jgi:streptopain